MTTASGVRVGWTDLPPGVRHAVERIVGAPVVVAVSKSGGFEECVAGLRARLDTFLEAALSS